MEYLTFVCFSFLVQTLVMGMMAKISFADIMDIPRVIMDMYHEEPIIAAESVTSIGLVLLLGLGLIVVALRLLHINAPLTAPFLYFNDTAFNRSILQRCPILKRP